MINLLELQSQKKAIVETVLASGAQISRLRALGIVANATIKKLNHTTPRGPILVTTAYECDVAMDQDLASKIIVRF